VCATMYVYINVYRLPNTPVRPMEEHFPGVGAQALDLLKSMLNFHPHRRITVGEALQHPFMESLRK
jgi:serine/threonine protein kinase